MKRVVAFLLFFLLAVCAEIAESATIYTVAFNSNGGTGKMVAQKITYGKTTKLKGNAFKRKSCVFIGWAKSKALAKKGKVAYKNQARVRNLAKQGKTSRLFAVWAKKSYKVVFYSNGGTGKMAVLKMTYGKAKNLSENKFKKKGYAFKGWAKSKDLANKGKIAYKNKKSVKNLVKDGKTVKLYAVWEKQSLPVVKEGLGVQVHTEQDIRSFIAAHPVSYSLTYSETPSISYPYVLGRISNETRTSALNMLNVIRYIAGLNANVTSDGEYERLAQAACIADAACGQLSHFPDKVDDMDQQLYQLGATGARSCNLGWNHFSLDEAIREGWLDDSDSYNIDRLGHRRWILNPPMQKTGFGYADAYSAMYAFDRAGVKADDVMVAWPAQTMPTEFFDSYTAWSLSTDTTPGSDVRVTLTRRSDNRIWNFSQESSDGYFNVNSAGYGQWNCIIFRPDGIDSYNSGDVFNVKITGLASGIVSYDVSFFTALP